MKKGLQHAKRLALGVSLLAGAASSHAQTSVTLYGIVDNALTYSSNETTLGSTSNGHSNFKMSQGAWIGSQFGLKGSEDLGGGLSAIFLLVNRFNSANGAAQFPGAAFAQQSYVGLADKKLGTVTMGRGFTSYYWMLAPYSPTKYLTGFTGAHPGDIDNLDTDYKTSNTVRYISPTVSGVTFSGDYSLGGVPGCMNCGASWSVGANYIANSFGIAAAVERFNNSNSQGGAWGANSTATTNGQQGVSALTNGFQTAAAQQRFAVTGGYTFTDKVDVQFAYSNVQYIPGVASSFRNLAIWNTVGVVGHYKPTPFFDVAAGYSLTRATSSNGIKDPAKYQQIALSQYYSLSKRTGLYSVQAYQHATGQTLGSNGVSIINATATVGDGFNGSPSAGPSQFVVTAGLVHRF